VSWCVGTNNGDTRPGVRVTRCSELGLLDLELFALNAGIVSANPIGGCRCGVNRHSKSIGIAEKPRLAQACPMWQRRKRECIALAEACSISGHMRPAFAGRL
jgi:hypothetical protein